MKFLRFLTISRNPCKYALNLLPTVTQRAPMGANGSQEASKWTFHLHETLISKSTPMSTTARQKETHGTPRGVPRGTPRIPQGPNLRFARAPRTFLLESSVPPRRNAHETPRGVQKTAKNHSKMKENANRKPCFFKAPFIGSDLPKTL